MLALAPNAHISTSTKSSWKHLDEKTVMDRLFFLAEHPNLINQGALGLCGEATFYHHILERLLNKGDFFRMAQALFRDGICRLGDLKIKTRERLRNAPYSQIVAARVIEVAQALTLTPPKHLAPMPQQADWMLLTALRDSENFWSHEYEGRPGQSKAQGSTFHEQKQWYRQSGLYKKVRPAVIEEISPIILKKDIFRHVRKTDTNHILMGINMAMIRADEADEADEEHAISLESALTFRNTLGEVIPTDDDNIRPSESVNWSVSFKYWSWGDEFTKILDPNVVMTFDHFQRHLRATIIAEF